mmetsp:Transcript_42132/g.106024  ORF Transcript_42132/g.106024 Transcript_42132/m.106024 type:complete len:340 (+) Transcript_42132:555-1574(+)
MFIGAFITGGPSLSTCGFGALPSSSNFAFAAQVRACAVTREDTGWPSSGCVVTFTPKISGRAVLCKHSLATICPFSLRVPLDCKKSVFGPCAKAGMKTSYLSSCTSPFEIMTVPGSSFGSMQSAGAEPFTTLTRIPRRASMTRRCTSEVESCTTPPVRLSSVILTCGCLARMSPTISTPTAPAPLTTTVSACLIAAAAAFTSATRAATPSPSRGENKGSLLPVATMSALYDSADNPLWNLTTLRSASTSVTTSKTYVTPFSLNFSGLPQKNFWCCSGSFKKMQAPMGNSMKGLPMQCATFQPHFTASSAACLALIPPPITMMSKEEEDMATDTKEKQRA